MKPRSIAFAETCCALCTTRLPRKRPFVAQFAIAQGQSAKLSELIAVLSLSRLWYGQGKRAEARDLLVPIYNGFTEGFDTPVLRDAKALLDDLAK